MGAKYNGVATSRRHLLRICLFLAYYVSGDFFRTVENIPHVSPGFVGVRVRDHRTGVRVTYSSCPCPSDQSLFMY